MKNPRNSSDSSSDDIMNDLKPVSKGIAQQEKVRESVALDKKVSDREAYMKSTIDEIEEECRREEKNKRDQGNNFFTYKNNPNITSLFEIDNS